MTNLRQRDRIALGVVLVLGLLGAFYKFALSPERQKASSLQTQITTARQQLVSAQQSYASGRLAQASLKANLAEWNAIHLAVPSQPDIPALLRTLERTAKAVHVNMQAISMTAGTGTAAAATTPAAPATTSATTSGGTTTGGTSTVAAVAPTSVPLQLTFSGGYTALNNLVRSLTGLVQMSKGTLHASGPLLSVDTVNLSGTSKLTVQLSASIYESAAASSTSGSSTGGQG